MKIDAKRAYKILSSNFKKHTTQDGEDAWSYALRDVPESYIEGAVDFFLRFDSLRGKNAGYMPTTGEFISKCRKIKKNNQVEHDVEKSKEIEKFEMSQQEASAMWKKLLQEAQTKKCEKIYDELGLMELWRRGKIKHVICYGHVDEQLFIKNARIFFDVQVWGVRHLHIMDNQVVERGFDGGFAGAYESVCICNKNNQGAAAVTLGDV